MKKRASALFVFIVTVFFVDLISANTNINTVSNSKPRLLGNAKLFGLPLNNLALHKLEKRLNEIGLQSYPSYKDGVANYSLGPEGILGVTNAVVFSNSSGYINQALLSGVVESNIKRKALGNLLIEKYGAPNDGGLLDGIGRALWLFKEGTRIELYNSTFNVSIMYVDERPGVTGHRGKIDVEALSQKK